MASQDADAALDAVRAVRPDVVVTDIGMPPTWLDEGPRLADRLRSSSGRRDRTASVCPDT